MDISPHTWPCRIPNLLTCGILPYKKTLEGIPGPASTIWLPYSLVLFPGVVYPSCLQLPPCSKLSYSCIPVKQRDCPSSECDPWWNVSHLSTYPFPLFLAILLGPREFATGLNALSISLLSFVFRSRDGQFGEVLLSMSDYCPILPFPGGVKFSSIPTLKRF